MSKSGNRNLDDDKKEVEGTVENLGTQQKESLREQQDHNEAAVTLYYWGMRLGGEND